MAFVLINFFGYFCFFFIFYFPILKSLTGRCDWHLELMVWSLITLLVTHFLKYLGQYPS